MNPGWMSQISSQMQAASTSGHSESLNASANIDHDVSTMGTGRHYEHSGHPVSTSDFITATNCSDEADTDEEVVTVTRYGSVNSSILDVTRQRSQSIGNMTAGSDIHNGLLVVDKMRRRLRFYFMNPLEKWQTKRQFPFKLAIQLIKIFFVTFQLILFASYRYANVNYTWDNKISFSHLFLMNWDTSREITSYPPTTGPLAIYTKNEFYEYIDYAIKAYSQIEELAIGPYFYSNSDGSMAPINLCVEKYTNGIIYGFNESYVFDSKTERNCLEIQPSAMNSTVRPFSIKSYIAENNFSISFDSLLEADLLFTLKTVRFRDLGPLKSPDCFQFDISISFNNRDHDGQTLMSLDAIPTRLLCKGDVEYVTDNRLEKIGRSGVNYIVIGMCTLSLVLCCRAIYRAQLLKAEVLVFFKKYFQQELSTHERLDFLNFWYVLIIFNDILIIIGSALKEQIENKELTGEAWNVCSLLLGIGNLLVWFGVLRYLGFFRTYNVLILTLKRASPNVLRFLICAILIYAGFTFCGWLILGPYHMKFSSLSTTSECLFALINGDDMFATFAGMSSKSNLLWWFCRIYLYTFISLFIYVVLSLFIALIMDAYETIKLYYTEGFPRTTLQEFIIGSDANNMNNMGCGGSTYSTSHLHPQHHTHIHHNSVGRKTSAGGILDTIVETICGVNNATPTTDAETSGESEPLLASA